MCVGNENYGNQYKTSGGAVLKIESWVYPLSLEIDDISNCVDPITAQNLDGDQGLIIQQQIFSQQVMENIYFEFVLVI